MQVFKERVRLLFINKNIKYRDILIFALIGVIGYKIIDNYYYFFSIAKKIMSILLPFIYALVFAYIFNPVVGVFEKRFKMKRSFSIGITYCIFSGVIFISLFFTIPSIIDSIVNIIKEMPVYMETIQGWTDVILKNKKMNDLITQAGLLGKLEELSTHIGNYAVILLQGVATYLLSFTANLINLVLGFLISIYVLMDKDRFTNGAKIMIYMILDDKRGNSLITLVRTYHKMIGTYIGIKAIDSLIIGIISLIGLIIVGAPYAPLIAVFVGITNMIPYFGPLIGEIFGAIISLFVSPVKAIVVFCLLLAIQQFDGWYLDPKLIGDRVGVRPFWIILAVVIAGGFFGPIGMLLASPTIATINIYYDKKVNKFKANNLELFKREKLE